MRIFSIGPNGGFTEYERLPFAADHVESELEGWLEANPDGILDDGPLLIIGRQVSTDLGGSIDLLGVDREGNVVVVELKRDRTPRDVLAQALEYAAFAARLDVKELEGILGKYRPDGRSDLADQHCEYFDQARAVAFNRDQRIVVVGQQISPEIRQTASFLNRKGIQVTCVEFSFFRDTDGRRLLSQESVVGREHAKPPRASTVTKEEFLKSCDDHGRAVFSSILDLAAREGMSLSWGVKGFTIGVDDMAGTRVVICFVYPPSTRFRQSIWTALGSDHYGIRKMGAPAEVVEQLWKRAEQTGLFVPAGRDLSCHVDRAFTDAEVDALVAWCESVKRAIRVQPASG
jgi:hypothetical protein